MPPAACMRACLLTGARVWLLLQRWVRPKPRAAAAARRGGEGIGGLLGASSAQQLAGGEGLGAGLAPLAREGSVGQPARVDTHLAVPVHDYLEDEAPIDGALLARQGHGQRWRPR